MTLTRERLKELLPEDEFYELMRMMPWMRQVDEIRIAQARRQGRVEREGQEKMKRDVGKKT